MPATQSPAPAPQAQPAAPRLARRLLAFALTLALSWPILFWLAFRANPLTIALFADERAIGGIPQKTLEWAADPAMRDTLDVVFVGSSVCYSGIDPQALEAYGLTGFNFCSSSQALSVSVELAVNAVAESAAEVVVLDTYTWFVEPLESTRDWVTNSALWDEPWKSSLHRLSAQTQDPYTFLLSHFYPILRSSRPLGATLPSDPTTDYQHRGFATRTFPPLDGPLDPTAPPHAAHCAENLAGYSAAVCEAFTALRSRLPAHTSILVLTPPRLCPPGYSRPACIPPSSWLVGASWPGATAFPHYLDEHHLSPAGAASYSPWLAHEIHSHLKTQ